MNTAEISKQVEKAVNIVHKAHKKGLGYDKLGVVISKTALEFDLTEAHIRTVGCWPLKEDSSIKLITPK